MQNSIPDQEGERNEHKRLKLDEQEAAEISIPDQVSIDAFSNSKWYKVPDEAFGKGCIIIVEYR